jgi:hypothetical protein
VSVPYRIISNLRCTFFFSFFFSSFFSSKLKVKACFKVKVLFFTFLKSQENHIAVRTSGLGKRVVNFMASEMYLLAKIVDFFNSLINAFKTYLHLSN